MKIKKLLNYGLALLALGLALIHSGAQAAEAESESFKKYGQEF